MCMLQDFTVRTDDVQVHAPTWPTPYCVILYDYYYTTDVLFHPILNHIVNTP